MLEDAGYEAFIVGGCVRDALRGITPKDYDITTSALPEETKSVFRDYRVIETGIQHGTVTVMMDGMPLEITTYRTEGTYSDNRHPDSVSFTTSLREDVARRDFTMNAIAYSPVRGLIDYFGGAEDIRGGTIRCVGDPDTRFREDALRMMRGIRFASALGFAIEEKTAAAIRENKERISAVSAERIRVELTKLLCGANVKNVLMNWWDVLGVVIPEILPMHGFDQRTPYHIYDVWEHTAVAVSETPPVTHLRLSALLHDIGKPPSFFTDEKGVGHFYGHPAVSEKMAEEILARLKYDNVTRRRVVTLVREHDRIIEPTETAVKRALSRLTPEVFFNLLAIKRADNLAQSPNYRDRLETYDRIESMAQDVLERNECISVATLAVNGGDLIALGMKPGKEIGEMLSLLLEQVIRGDLANDRDELLTYVKKKMR
ncbi:MAG: HD domain-containing protein [Clostridia bacterium]|nr:HD domain-containing protein [Clostridia bacterium]